MSRPRVDACTIVSCNYIPFARVLARSFLEQQPESRFFVLLLDRIAGRLEVVEEPFELIEVEDLGEVPDLRSFLFRYTILEANTAVKPFFLRHLFEQQKVERLLYLDPDILVTGSLDPLAERVDGHSIVVTPHLTDPIDDGRYPGEQAVLQAGSFNLGFLGLRRDDVSAALLRWWEERLLERCIVRIEDGLFVDQKWMDLTPGLFGDVDVVRDPGLNVAYWNLHGRVVKHDEGTWTSNGRPLVFFHFSGIQPESLDQVSKHQDRFRLHQIGDAAELYRHYSDLLLDAGWRETRSWSYAFGTFDDGVAIPDVARRLYLDMEPAERERFGDPFRTDHASSFRTWLGEPAGPASGAPGLSRLLAGVLRTRPDLREAYPDAGGRNRADFTGWLRTFGRHELRLDPWFLAELPEDRPSLWSLGAWKRRLRNRLKRVWHSKPGERVRSVARRWVGPERSDAIRRRLRPEPPPADTGASGGLHRWQGRFPPPRSLERPGINLIGYLDAETGMGQAARGIARALKDAGIPTSLHSLDLHVLARREDRSLGAEVRSEFPWDVNLLVVNADQVEPVIEHLGIGPLAGRYNVGLWLWEVDRFPADRWPGAFPALHEIWTPSRFCLDAISAESPIPVRRVPLPVPDPGPPRYGRDHFDLPDDAFVVFFMFNYLSVFARKNPLAAIRSFEKAFADDPKALFLLKTSHGEIAPQAAETVRAAVGRAKGRGARIRLVEGYLDRSEIDSLSGLCDAYLSLHRSEGFGLTLAEAMVRGRPVVATDYSGNEDFLDPTTGMPVPFEAVEIGDDAEPYPGDGTWADPDVEEAADALRRLRSEPELARRLARDGRRRVLEKLSTEAVGAILRQRFDRIVRERNRQTRRPPH